MTTSDISARVTGIRDELTALISSLSTTVRGPNLIPHPTNLLAGDWGSVAASASVNQGAALDGTSSLSKITDNTTNSRHIFYQGQLNPQTAGNYAFSVYLKQGTLRYAQLALADGSNVYGKVFDLQTGAATDTHTQGSPTGTSASIVPTVISGLWLATITMDFSGGSQNLYPVIATSNSATPTYDSNGNPTYTGTGQYLYAWNATLTPSLTVSALTSPWGSVGYNTNTLHVGPFTTANVDMSLTKTSGFGFYLTGAFGNPDTLPSHVTINADGSITLTGNNGTGGNIGASLSSVSGVTSAPYTNWKGTAYGGGAYFEATMSFNPSGINSVNGANGFPAWWADPVEHIVQSPINSDNWVGQTTGFVHFCELDFFEYNAWTEDDRLFTYNGTVIDWSGIWTGSTYPVILQNSQNRRIQLPPGTDFTKPHRYGFLWVPATPTTQGYFQWFFDGLPTSDRVTYSYYDPVNPPSPPATSSSPWLFGVADTQHYQLFLNTDTNGSLTIYSVDVWQASSAGNIVK